ncbi:hypothetical protein NSS79_25905 [Paenibacillus sp. FSL L8-0436]|uniref:hypothetical protein n=1 Tax=Paenibacillus sp. FSL L8-0436 TaxID=2954686 RepID=UPI0031580A6D
MGKAIYLNENEIKFLRVALDEMGNKLGHVVPDYYADFESFEIMSNDEIFRGFDSLNEKVERIITRSEDSEK